ncbi:MAG: single-stranded DNA-binding protein [bacterium]
MLNHIVLMGRLVRDPELRRTQSGIAVTSMRIAVDRDFKSENGERQADFIDIVAWRGTAEYAAKYFTKGRMIVVSGRLQMRDWTDKDGGKRTSAEVVADNLYFGDSRRDGDNQSGGYQQQGGYQQNNYSQQGGYQQQSYQPRPQQSGYSREGGYQSPAQAYQGYNSPVGGSDFAELGDDDGDLPF